MLETETPYNSNGEGLEKSFKQLIAILRIFNQGQASVTITNSHPINLKVSNGVRDLGASAEDITQEEEIILDQIKQIQWGELTIDLFSKEIISTIQNFKLEV